MIETIIELSNNIFKLFLSNIEKRKFKGEVIEKIILHRLSLKYLPKDYDFSEIAKTEMLFGEYIRIYLGKDFYNAYVNKSTNIFWAARYKSKIGNEIIEQSLEEFISLAKSKRLLRKDI